MPGACPITAVISAGFFPDGRCQAWMETLCAHGARREEGCAAMEDVAHDEHPWICFVCAGSGWGCGTEEAAPAALHPGAGCDAAIPKAAERW